MTMTMTMTMVCGVFTFHFPETSERAVSQGIFHDSPPRLRKYFTGIQIYKLNGGEEAQFLSYLNLKLTAEPAPRKMDAGYPVANTDMY